MIKDTIFCCGERPIKSTTNRMADVAGIFGLRIGEFFKLKDDGHILEMRNINGGYDEVIFWFTEDGVEHDNWYSVLNADEEDNVHLLFDIIVGEYEIVKLTGRS